MSFLHFLKLKVTVIPTTTTKMMEGLLSCFLFWFILQQLERPREKHIKVGVMFSYFMKAY